MMGLSSRGRLETFNGSERTSELWALTFEIGSERMDGSGTAIAGASSCAS
jgi:hypothetical protein